MRTDSRLTLPAGLLAWCAAVTSCSDSSRIPTAPETGVLQALSVSGLREDFSVGETAQLRAEAVWSTGNREDVTISARWSSRTVVCVVTASGLATALAEGDCSVDAAYGGVSASVAVRVKPSRVFTITGVVREKWGFREPPIPGATVTLTSGTQAGRTVTTDGAGRYLFAGVPVGMVSGRAEVAEFDTSTLDFSPERATADFLLVPLMEVISWSSTTGAGPLPVTPSLTEFEIRHTGPVTLTVSSTWPECQREHPTFWVHVENLAVHEFPFSQAACPPGVTLTQEKILNPGRYELAIRWLSSGASGTVRRVELKHPR